VANTQIAADQFKTATFKPDGKSIGSAGTVDILVEDGRGGSATASLPITVRSSHHPPVLAGPSRVQMAQQILGIAQPISPDGDPLTVTINAVPRGTVQNGTAILHPGDRITPTELSQLSFWPEADFIGPAGSLRYTVDNGHGGTVVGSLDVEVGPSSDAHNAGLEAVVWENVRSSSDAAEIGAFLKLFPESRHIQEAKQRALKLNATSSTGKTLVAGSIEPAQPQAVASKFSVGLTDKPMVTTMTQPDATVSIPPPSVPSGVLTAANIPPMGSPATPSRVGNIDTNKFQDCPTCPWMIRIPAGGFMMGQGAHEPESMPAHHVDIRSFAIGQTPVTVIEWKACQATNGCNFFPRMRVAEDRTPVHNLSWEDVGQYMSWLSKTTGHAYRLPSEAEWEYAARGGTTTQYWWGDSVGMALANCTDCGGSQGSYGPLLVDALQPNPFGLYDTLGGVSQWMADCWSPNYRGAPADGMPREAKACDKRVLRGGSYRVAHDEITVTHRGNYDASVRYLVNGFRVARDLP
jgi:formylglycine-generating enzyme required for sulfatase activity